MIGLAITAWVLSFLVMMLNQRRLSRSCPSCATRLAPLPLAQLHRSYEVLVCATCTNTVTAVHGARSESAYCPSCRQRSLETPVVRLPNGKHGPLVEVHEYCHLCEHQENVVFGRQDDERGRVLEFPKAGRRP